MALSSSAYKRLYRELTTLERSPPEGIRVVLDDSDISNIIGWIEGPPGTPYQGGYFKIKFQFSETFPNAPPKCWFATKIFHPNVAPSTGEICVSTLKKDWKKEYGVGHILITVKCLLIHPNPESALHEEAGKLLLEAYDDYARHAKLMTEIHARHRPAEFINTASSTTYQPYGPSAPSANTPAPVASTSAVPAAVPAKIASGSASYLQATSSTSNEIIMSEPVSENVKNVSSTSSSGSGSTSSSIPKKRAAPPVSAAIPDMNSTMSNGQDRKQGVLGASSVGVSSGNGTVLGKKVTPAASQTGTTQAAKKRGLKRL